MKHNYVTNPRPSLTIKLYFIKEIEISNCCKKHNIPCIAFVYNSPLVSLYSYTIINPCNYIFLFDQQTYLELKNKNIPTIYYMPLAVNTSRMDKINASAGDWQRWNCWMALCPLCNCPQNCTLRAYSTFKIKKSWKPLILRISRLVAATQTQ